MTRLDVHRRLAVLTLLVGTGLSCSRSEDSELAGGTRLTYAAEDPEKVEEARKVLRARLDSIGLSRVRTSITGSGRIIVEVPAGDNRLLETVKRLSASPGSLSFHVVDEVSSTPPSPAVSIDLQVDEESMRDLEERVRRAIEETVKRLEDASPEASGPDSPVIKVARGSVERERVRDEEQRSKAETGMEGRPSQRPGTIVCPELRRDAESDELERDPTTGEPIVERWWVLRDDDAGKVSPVPAVEARFESRGGGSRAALSLSLDRAGAEALARLTRENLRRELAIVLDGVVLCAARLHDEIPDGRVLLSPGAVPEWEVKAWAGVLGGGPLPGALPLENEECIPEARK